jgi:hypothetical protein
MLYGLHIQMYRDNTAATCPVHVINFVIVSDIEIMLFYHLNYRAMLQGCINVISRDVSNINIRNLVPEYDTTLEW